jgi:hypothetical protein
MFPFWHQGILASILHTLAVIPIHTIQLGRQAYYLWKSYSQRHVCEALWAVILSFFSPQKTLLLQDSKSRRYRGNPPAPTISQGNISINANVAVRSNDYSMRYVKASVERILPTSSAHLFEEYMAPIKEVLIKLSD